MPAAVANFEVQAEHFELCVEHVRLMEGGKVNRASDPGGSTNFGITQTTLTDAREVIPDLPLTVETLTWPDAKRIYQVHYWSAIRGYDLPLAYALVTLDAAVNHGPHRAVRFLQQGLGVPDDGWIGVRTISRAHAVRTKAALKECMARRTHFFMLQDSMDDEYGLGWARRVMSTFAAAIEVL